MAMAKEFDAESQRSDFSLVPSHECSPREAVIEPDFNAPEILEVTDTDSKAPRHFTEEEQDETGSQHDPAALVGADPHASSSRPDAFRKDEPQYDGQASSSSYQRSPRCRPMVPDIETTFRGVAIVSSEVMHRAPRPDRPEGGCGCGSLQNHLDCDETLMGA
eukprot:CAMPEP_0117615154 /NCGR_PEP_ID=MMETSP0784-20121206/84398_1 /TAXON_ID=39447 /ORGANISM="" /LENGTH=161 /DNA_ID=CAMNT_0005418891 /DNA_START=45 /DNA_END=529 /DNA_ORIENTATION=+